MEAVTDSSDKLYTSDYVNMYGRRVIPDDWEPWFKNDYDPQFTDDMKRILKPNESTQMSTQDFDTLATQIETEIRNLLPKSTHQHTIVHTGTSSSGVTESLPDLCKEGKRIGMMRGAYGSGRPGSMLSQRGFAYHDLSPYVPCGTIPAVIIDFPATGNAYMTELKKELALDDMNLENLEKQLRYNNIGVLLFEIFTADGVRGHTASFLAALRALCTKLQISLVLDDTMMSMRCGLLFSYLHYADLCIPDYIIVGKPWQTPMLIATGKPQGTPTRINGAVYSAMRKTLHLLRLLTPHRLLQNIKSIGKVFHDVLTVKQDEHKKNYPGKLPAAEFYGIGAIWWTNFALNANSERNLNSYSFSLHCRFLPVFTETEMKVRTMLNGLIDTNAEAIPNIATECWPFNVSHYAQQWPDVKDTGVCTALKMYAAWQKLPIANNHSPITLLSLTQPIDIPTRSHLLIMLMGQTQPPHLHLRIGAKEDMQSVLAGVRTLQADKFITHTEVQDSTQILTRTASDWNKLDRETKTKTYHACFAIAERLTDAQRIAHEVEQCEFLILLHPEHPKTMNYKESDTLTWQWEPLWHRVSTRTVCDGLQVTVFRIRAYNWPEVCILDLQDLHESLMIGYTIPEFQKDITVQDVEEAYDLQASQDPATPKQVFLKEYIKKWLAGKQDLGSLWFDEEVIVSDSDSDSDSDAALRRCSPPASPMFLDVDSEWWPVISNGWKAWWTPGFERDMKKEIEQQCVFDRPNGPLYGHSLELRVIKWIQSILDETSGVTKSTQKGKQEMKITMTSVSLNSIIKALPLLSPYRKVGILVAENNPRHVEGLVSVTCPDYSYAHMQELSAQTHHEPPDHNGHIITIRGTLIEHNVGVLVFEVFTADARGHTRAFLTELHNLCKELRVLLVLDDSMMSMRCGHLFSYQHYGEVCVPDFIIVGKTWYTCMLISLKRKTKQLHILTSYVEYGMIRKTLHLLRLLLRHKLLENCRKTAQIFHSNGLVGVGSVWKINSACNTVHVLPITEEASYDFSSYDSATADAGTIAASSSSVVPAGRKRAREPSSEPELPRAKFRAREPEPEPEPESSLLVVDDVGSALLPPKPIAMPAIAAKPVKPAAAKPGLAHAVPPPFRTQLIQPSGASILDVDVVDDSDYSDEIIEIPAPQPDQNGPANARPGPANQSIERSMRRMNRTVAKRKAENIHFQGS